MRLSKVKIENFRGITEIEIELDRDITVIIGENNCGKTSILEALRFGLDTIKSNKTCNFSQYDFYRDNDHSDITLSDPIIFTFSFLESEEHPWPDHITQVLNDVIVGADYSAIKLRLTGKYDTVNAELTQDWSFLDDADNEIPNKQNMIKELRKLRPFFFQSALRAAKDEFHGQSTYWSSFIKNKDIDDATKQALEIELFTVNQKIIDAHSSFNDITDEVKRISDLVSVGHTDPVSVDPIPSDIYKSLRYTEVNLLTNSNAKIPIRSHGEGTQSLSVLLLFSAYLKKRLHADTDRHAEAIIAIEEPEAHLHPNATRAIWHLLKDLPGQKIIATHSGDILSEVPVEKLRRLSRQDSSVDCHSIPIGLLQTDELRKFNHHVRRNRGELLFAKTWLLVEGETDITVLSECAEILGINLSRLGIRLIEYSQVGLNVFIKVADKLGIKWFLTADGDSAGQNYIQSAEAHLNGRSKNDYMKILSFDNMEVLLSMNGFGEVYKTKIGAQQQHLITETEGTLAYWEQVCKTVKSKSKPVAALEAIFLMNEQGEDSVPTEIKDILSKVTESPGGTL